MNLCSPSSCATRCEAAYTHWVAQSVSCNLGADTQERLCEAVIAYLVEVDVLCLHYDVHRVLQTMNFEDDYDGAVNAGDVIAGLMQRLPAKITAV